MYLLILSLPKRYLFFGCLFVFFFLCSSFPVFFWTNPICCTFHFHFLLLVFCLYLYFFLFLTFHFMLEYRFFFPKVNNWTLMNNSGKSVCAQICRYKTYIKNEQKEGFPGGAVVKNPPANARDTGLSPGLGRSHMPQSN